MLLVILIQCKKKIVPDSKLYKAKHCLFSTNLSFGLNVYTYVIELRNVIINGQYSECGGSRYLGLSWFSMVAMATKMITSSPLVTVE